MEIKNGNNFNKKFNIPSKIKSYKIEKELCLISNAHLCLGTNLNIKEKVLIKIYDKEIIQHNSEEISLINNDIFMMRLINHKNVLKLYEIIESPSYIILIMEYFNPIKLNDYLKTKLRLNEDESLNIFKQLISLLLYFNEMNIGHLNINPNDILIDNTHNIKICDFKYSVFYSSTEEVKCKNIGDANYLCPELLSEKKCYPEMADIWSSGVLLYLCLIGQLPFKGINNYDLQKKIMGGEFALPLNISKNLQELFKNIFAVKTDSRYNLENILNSALFKEKKINKNNLSKGLNILSTKYPIDERVLNICKTYYDIEPEDLKQKLYKNIFDPQTSLYKQIITKFIRKKISTEIDLSTKKFNNYIENKKYILDDTEQKNNIEDILNKIEETNTGNSKLKKEIEEKEGVTLIKLDELIEKYKNKVEEEEPEKNEEKEIQNEKEENKEENKENIDKNKEENKENLDKNKEENKENINKNKEENKENINKNKEENKEKLDKNKEENKENINKNKDENIPNTIPKKKYKRRGSVNENPKTKHLDKLGNYENKLSISRRKSSALDTDTKIKETLEHLNYKEISDFEVRNKTSKKYIPQQSEIIKEIKEEEKKDPSPNKSITSSKKSIFSKSSTKKSIFKKTETNNKEKKDKDIKISSRKSKTIKPIEKKNTTTKAPPPQVTKEDFFKQIKNVKLKKYTPNTYANPDEIKRKPKEENKNATSVEYTNVSVKNVLKMVEENLKNAKKNKNTKINSTTIAKKTTFKNNKSNKKTYENKKFKRRKSIKNKDLSMFQKKGLLINKNDVKNVKSKDDVSRFKFRVKKHNDDVMDVEVNDMVLPKDYKTEKKIKEEKRKKYEEKRRKEEEENRKRKEREEKERREKRELEEKKKRELEEKKRKEWFQKKEREEREERQRRELAEKRRRELQEQRLREIEERQKKEQEELLLRQKEEERIRKEKEEEERRIKEKEEEEERQRLAEEEMRRKREEERERRIKEREEEDRRREEEERLRKEKEKERKRLEEEEKIRKWKEEARRQKELEEKLKKEAEEREKKEEEERIRKRLEDSERKRREIQEENKRRFEEYERMRKEEEDKRLMREQMRKKKDEEIRQMREKEIKEKREFETKKIVSNLQFNYNNESYSSSSEEDEEEENTNRKKENIQSNNIEQNHSSPNKKNINKYTLGTNPFELYKDQYSDESSTPKAAPKKNIQKKRVSIQVIKKKRKTGPKLVDLNKFRESELFPSESESESYDDEVIKNKAAKKKSIKENEQKLVNINDKTKNRLYSKFTDYFFNSNIFNKTHNEVKKDEEKEQKIEEKRPKFFYHYQKNKGKEEPKSFYERNFQNKKNNRNNSLEQRLNSSYTTKNNNNYNSTLNKTKNIIPSYNIKPIKMKQPKNNNNKNSAKVTLLDQKEYKTQANITNFNKINLKKTLKKNNTKKGILKTKTELAKIKTLQKFTNDSDINAKIKKNSIINSIENLNRYLTKNSLKNKTLDYDGFDYNDLNSVSQISNSSLTTKNRNKNYFNIRSDYDLNGSNLTNKTVIKIKNNYSKSKMNLKEEDLTLYKGEINYSNVSAKSVGESINELINKYKLKGYTCIKKDKNKFKFIKGPNIHNVEIMRLGNGLLYFNINKL